MSTKNTPLPWDYYADHVWDAEGGIVAAIDMRGSEANGRHIVRCVNAHDDLLAACKALIKSPDYVDVTIANGTKAKALMCWAHEWDQLHAAIARAECAK